MRFLIQFLVFTIFFVGSVNGQNNSDSTDNHTKEILLPSEQDMSEAKRQGFEVFKILPRGMFDYEKNELSIRGGGAYYSFTKKSHSYNEIPQIELQQDRFSVGFYGLNYGFIVDLLEIPLSEISEQTYKAEFLYNYKPPKFVSEIISEQREVCSYCGLYTRNIPAVVGHSYILRAISFEKDDALVAFNVQRKNSDGSLIIFWKLLKQFEMPIALEQPDVELKTKIENILSGKSFNEVSIDVKDNIIILRGTVPRGRKNEFYGYLTGLRSRGFNDSLIEK